MTKQPKPTTTTTKKDKFIREHPNYYKYLNRKDQILVTRSSSVINK